MNCEHHGREAITETDLVVTRLGPNRVAVMAGLRGPMLLNPRAVGEMVRAGPPIVVGTVYETLDYDVAETTEAHLRACGATVERWQRSYCEIGLEPDDGAIA